MILSAGTTIRTPLLPVIPVSMPTAIPIVSSTRIESNSSLLHNNISHFLKPLVPDQVTFGYPEYAKIVLDRWLFLAVFAKYKKPGMPKRRKLRLSVPHGTPVRRDDKVIQRKIKKI